MPDLFSTDTMMEIVRDLRTPAIGLAAAKFNRVIEHESEEVHFDIENKGRRLAPLVSPLVAGKVMKSRGYRTDSLKPAYIKDKRNFEPNRALKRVMGERIGGAQLTPAQRREILLVQDMTDQLEMLERRMEWMACQALRDGAITLSGEEYQTVVVDFGRPAEHTVVKTSGNKWGDAGINPLDDLQDWSDLMLKNSGVAMTDVDMTVDVWKVFRKHSEVKSRLDAYRGNSTLQPDAKQKEGRVFMGVVDNFNIYTYSGWYEDPTSGVTTPFLPGGTVIGTGGDDAVDGVRHHGAIMDHESLMAEAYFVKSWTENDPSVRVLLMQSAPLLVPHRVTATFRATVL